MKITLVCTLLFAVLLKSSNQQCLTPNDAQRPNVHAQSRFYHGQQEFSLRLLQALNQLAPNENLFFSPHSTYHALLIAYFITGKEIENYLKKILFLDPDQNKADIFTAYKLDKLATSFRAINSSHEFTYANRIYIPQQEAAPECLTTIFSDELATADFQSNLETIRTDINQWVERQTHNMVKDLLPFGSINKQTNLLLASAAYYKGKWEYKFNITETKREIFYISVSTQTFVDMMYMESSFTHDISETLMAHILELPYEGGDISMYIFLPPFSKDGIETVLKKLTLENFKNLVDSSPLPRQVQVFLPRFSLEHTIELASIPEYLRVGNPFEQSAGLFIGSRELSVGGMHKAKIEVNEEGTKHATATPLFSWKIMEEETEPVQFKCNRPFIFVLYNKMTHTILFTGVYRKPE